MGTPPSGTGGLRPSSTFASDGPGEKGMTRFQVPQSCPPHQAIQGAGEAVKVGLRGVVTSNDDEVPSPGDFREAYRLSQPALCLVSHHRLPYSPPNHEAEPADGQVVWRGDYYEPPVGPAPALASRSGKVPGSGDTPAAPGGPRAGLARWHCQTVSLWRPLNMRRRRTLRPPLLLMRDLKPCTLARRRLRG